MLFEMAIDGHHSTYVQHLVRYWCEQGLSGNFHIVVTAEFMKKCADVVAIAQQYPKANVFFLPLSSSEEATLNSTLQTFFQRKARAWQEWNLMRAYAKKVQATHCLLASFDFFSWPFVLAQRPPCPISGIYFKPTFHYASFPGHTTTFKSRLQQRQERFWLSVILWQPHLHRLLCLDPFAVEALNQRHAHSKAVVLADPVKIPTLRSPTSALKSQLNIESHRKVFLLFGSLTARKGISQMLEAITLLPFELSQKLCFLLVGSCNLELRHQLHSKIVQVRSDHPVQIIEQYGFVREQTVQDYFQLADVVLAPYQKHVGMSGILLQAAAVRKPVLSSNYGLMGELVRRYQLGIAVDSTQPNDLMSGLSKLLLNPLNQFYSEEKMNSFVEENTVEIFSETIFNTLRHRQ